MRSRGCVRVVLVVLLGVLAAGLAAQVWGQTAEQLAYEYGLPVEAIQAALDYYGAHPEEIDALIQIEKDIEARHVKA